MQPLLKDILLENINNDVIYNVSDFLKSYNQPKSDFDYSAFDELKIFLMHKYHNHKNLSSLFKDSKISELLHTISAGLSLEQFKIEIKKLGLISTDRGISLEQLVHNSFNSRIINLSGWFKIYSDKIKGSTVNDPTQRIYLAVDNSYVHKFALLLIKQCELFHLSYQFKITNANGKNNYDNVVIYANENEIPTYINCLVNILNKYPEIKMNQQCLLAYPFDQNIAIAPYLDTKDKSYSQIVSSVISHYRENAESRLEFISNVDNYFNQMLKPTETLCDEIKNTMFYDSSCPSEIEISKKR